MKKWRGFTLVEMAIVLIIIGLIMGMAFKGRDLIDSARVKNIQAQYGKIVTGMHVYYEKYGAYPGDGCSSVEVLSGYVGSGCAPVSLQGNPRNGLISTPDEAAAAMVLMRNANILSAADAQSVFGQPWSIAPAGAGSGNFAANTAYLTLVSLQTNAADLRLVCQLDRVMDDGDPASGMVRSSAASGAGVGQYNAQSDCWAQEGMVAIGLRLLP